MTVSTDVKGSKDSSYLSAQTSSVGFTFGNSDQLIPSEADPSLVQRGGG